MKIINKPVGVLFNLEQVAGSVVNISNKKTGTESVQKTMPNL